MQVWVLPPDGRVDRPIAKVAEVPADVVDAVVASNGHDAIVMRSQRSTDQGSLERRHAEDVDWFSHEMIDLDEIDA